LCHHCVQSRLQLGQFVPFRWRQVLFLILCECHDQQALADFRIIRVNNPNATTLASPGRGTSDFMQTSGTANHIAFILHDSAFEVSLGFIRNACVSQNLRNLCEFNERAFHVNYSILFFSIVNMRGLCKNKNGSILSNRAVRFDLNMVCFNIQHQPNLSCEQDFPVNWTLDAISITLP